MGQKRNRKWHYFLILFYAVLMAGCNSTIKEKTERNTEQIPEQATKSTNSQSKEKGTSKDYEEDVLVWMINPPFSDEKIGKEFQQMWEQPLNRLLKEKNAGYQIKIELYGSPSGEYTENPEPASESLVERKDQGLQTDLITQAGTRYGLDVSPMRTEYQYASELGLLEPLDDYLESEEGLKEELFPQDIAKARVNGRIYGIYTSLLPIGGVAYPKEYLDKYRIDPKSLSGNIFDNETQLEKIAKGEKHPVYQIYLGDIGDRLPFFMEDEMRNLAYSEQTGYCNLLETEAYKEEYERLYEWKKRGLVQIQLEQEKDEVTAMDVTCYRTDTHEAVLIIGEKEVPVVVVPDTHRFAMNGYMGDPELGIASWSKKKDQAWDFIVRCYTDPEIANLICHGTEGTDYIIDQGYAVSKRKNAFQSNLLVYTNSLLSLPKGEEPEDKKQWMQEYYEEIEPPFPYGFRFCPEPVGESILAVGEVWDDPVGNANKKLIIGTQEERDFLLMRTDKWEEILDKIIADMNAAGMQKIVDEAQRQYEAWLKNTKNR